VCIPWWVGSTYTRRYLSPWEASSLPNSIPPWEASSLPNSIPLPIGRLSLPGTVPLTHREAGGLYAPHRSTITQGGRRAVCATLQPYPHREVGGLYAPRYEHYTHREAGGLYAPRYHLTSGRQEGSMRLVTNSLRSRRALCASLPTVLGKQEGSMRLMSP